MTDRYHLLQYLPELYRGGPLDGVLYAMGKALRRAGEDLDLTFQQLFPGTASSWGLELWEQAYGIPVDRTKAVEVRRAMIFSKIRGQGVPTVELIQSVAQSYAQGPVEVVEVPTEYRFSVVFVPNPALPVDADALIAAVGEVKPAHLAMDAVLLTREDITICTACGYAIYTARRCGTYPQTSTRGGVARGVVLVETAEQQATYTTPMTGAATAGTWPQAATRGGAVQGEMIVETDMVQTLYTTPATGESTTGTWPQVSTKGEIAGGGLTFGGATGTAGVYARPCGRPPGTL